MDAQTVEVHPNATALLYQIPVSFLLKWFSIYQRIMHIRSVRPQSQRIRDFLLGDSVFTDQLLLGNMLEWFRTC